LAKIHFFFQNLCNFCAIEPYSCKIVVCFYDFDREMNNKYTIQLAHEAVFPEGVIEQIKGIDSVRYDNKYHRFRDNRRETAG